MKHLFSKFLIPLILLAVLFSAFGQVFSAANDPYCPPPKAVLIKTRQEGNDLVLTWLDDSANDSYRVWQHNSEPFFDEGQGNIQDTLPQGSNQFTVTGLFGTPDVRAYFRVESQSICAAASAYSAHIGAANLPLSNVVGESSLISVPFAHDDLVDAVDLAEQIGSLNALLKWNEATQGFRVFLPPNAGDNFLINPGDAVFVNAASGGASSVAFHGSVVPTDVTLRENGYSFSSLPFQRTDLKQASTVSEDITSVANLLKWNESTQGFRVFIPPSGGDDFSILPGETFVTRLDAGGPSRWPGVDDGMMQWSQSGGGPLARDVLLQWQDGENSTWPGDGYIVFRRRIGETSWNEIKTVEFAANATKMANILGVDLSAILAYDLREDPNAPPLTPQEIYDRFENERGLAAGFANQYHEVAEAIGMAYLDKLVPDGIDFEYNVMRKEDEEWVTRPICAPAAPDIFTDFNLRESMVVNVPDGLGISPSPRPEDAVERFKWGRYQDVRNMHGRAFLVWDESANMQPPSDQNQCIEAPQLMVAGYNIYRNGPPEGTSFVKANLQTVGAAQAGSQRRLLASTAGVPEAGAPDAEPYYFIDEVAKIYDGNSPDDVFTDWKYYICAVDMLGNEIACSNPVSIPIRDLDSPASAIEPEITVASDHSKLTYSWSYTDTNEISLPLRFFVSRSQELTLSPTLWTDLTPGGILAASGSPTFTLSIDDTPPLNRPYWYRVQVRDSAGNWSAASAAISAGLYDRTPPAMPNIPNGDQCQSNSLPFLVSGMEKSVQQVTVYRAFDKTGPYQLIKRLEAEPGAGNTRFVWVDDLYIPPDTVTLHYKIEAIDAHGNVSEAAYFCSDHGQDHLPGPPEIWSDSEGTFDYTGDPVSDIITITVSTPSGTTTTTTTTLSGQLPTNAAPGQMVYVTVQSANESGASKKTTFWIFETNNFLDTHRHMHDLGAPVSVSWDLTGPEPIVEFELEEDKEAMPMVGVFRRIPGGNWMQVTPIQMPALISGEWMTYDKTDLNPGQAYSYTVMAFSPTSHELLGYWDEQFLPAATTPPRILLNETYVEVIQPNCTFNPQPPTGFNDPILLANGWYIDITQLFVDDGSPNCPPPTPVANNLFGSGQLQNSLGDSFPVYFYGIGLDGIGNLINGRITTNPTHQVNDPDRLSYQIDSIGFSPGLVDAKVAIFLPPALAMVDPVSGEPGTQIGGHVQNLTIDYQFDYLAYDGGGAGVTFVDENLPWRLNVSEILINHQFLAPNDVVLTSDRFTYPIQNSDNHTPDNNLAFMRRTFQSTNAYITGKGLQGNFDTFEPMVYHTSLPASFVMNVGPTYLVIEDSQIADGFMETYEVSLMYEQLGTSQDSFIDIGNSFFISCYWLLQYPDGTMPTNNNGCSPLPPIPSEYSYRLMEAVPSFGYLDIGAGGIISGNVVNYSADNPDIKWPQFNVPFDEVDSETGHLYLAAASFPEEDPADRLEPGSPLPVEVAWRQIPDPNASGGELDPGLNFNNSDQPFNYDFYNPSLFGGNVDLYLRRGGTSEQIKITTPDPTFRTNDFGYKEKITRFEVLFIDNWIKPDETIMEMDLYLPYPSDVTIPLIVTEIVSNIPKGGDIDGLQTLLHKYWSFTHRLLPDATWSYVPIADTVYPEQYELNTSQIPGTADLPLQIFDISGGQAVSIDGLYEKTGSNSAVQSTFPIDSQWLPTGDYGQIRLTAAQNDYQFVSGVPYVVSGLRLSHYYVGFLKTNSLPDTMGLELDMTGIELPEALLNTQGNLTQQSLKNCSVGNTVGCGFILLDGNGTADYFGEVEPLTGPGLTEFTPNLPDFLGDDPVGQFPIAVNGISRQTVQAIVNPSALRWYWQVANDTLNELCPFVFLPNDSVSLNPVPLDVPIGGVFACLKRDFPILPAPAPEVLVADLGLVVDFHLFKTMEVGIFMGYSASQAVYRALAMNRPLASGDSGVKPYTNWSDVSDDIELWSSHFGYNFDANRTNQNDPVDLAYDLWNDWNTTVPVIINPCRSNPSGDLTFNETDEVLEPQLRSLDGDDAYGVTGIEAGALLNFPTMAPPFDHIDPTAWFDTGMGQAVFCAAGLSVRVENIFFGAEMGVDLNSTSSLLDTDWVSMDMNRDGEYVITGENIQIGVMKDYGLGADLHLRILQSDPANERIEGSVHLREFESLVIDMNGLDVHFGSGKYNNLPIFYVGGEGEITGLFGIDAGLQVFYGTLNPAFPQLREAGFDYVFDAFTAEDLDTGSSGFMGFYGILYSEFDFDALGCLMSINARAELRGWYWESPEFPDFKAGGVLYGSLYGEVACLLSARGDVSLQFELVPTGAYTTPPPTWPSMTKQCQLGLPNYNGCYAGAGISWVAIGIGFDCDPHTWKGWSNRWWGDSWCWTFGAGIGMTFIGPTQSVGDVWDFDFEVDFEF